jgi:hypothetical protein
MAADDDWVCRQAMPGWSCHMPEMSILGILFFLEAILCVFCFISQYRRYARLHPNMPGYCSMTSDLVFWVFMTIWCIYEGLLRSVHFSYNLVTFNFFYGALIGISYLIPLSAVIMMICHLLLDYRGSSKRIMTLFRVIFAMFFGAFLVLAVGFAVVTWDYPNDPTSPMALWHGCIDLIIAVFVGAPAYALMRMISFPVVPVEHRKCLSVTKVLTAVFCAIMFIRCIYNITHGLRCNFLDKWFTKESAKPGKPSWKARTVQAVLVFIFDFCSSMAAIFGVSIWRANDVKFADKKFFRAELASTQEGDLQGHARELPREHRVEIGGP